jgi:hypothetical protein
VPDNRGQPDEGHQQYGETQLPMQAENALTILQRAQLAEKDGKRELTDDE